MKSEGVALNKIFFNLMCWENTHGVYRHHQRRFVDSVRSCNNRIVGHGTHVYLDTAHTMKIPHNQDTTLIGVSINVADMVVAWDNWYAFVFGGDKLLVIDFKAFTSVYVLTCGLGELREIGIDPNHRVFLKQSKGVTQMSTKDHIEEFKTLFHKYAHIARPVPHICSRELALMVKANNNILLLQFQNGSVEHIPLAYLEEYFKDTFPIASIKGSFTIFVFRLPNDKKLVVCFYYDSYTLSVVNKDFDVLLETLMIINNGNITNNHIRLTVQELQGHIDKLMAEGKFKRTTKPLENAPNVKPSANTAYVDFAKATDSFMNSFIDTTLLENYVGIHRVVNKLKNFLSDKIKQDYTTANPQSTENIVRPLFDFGIKDTVKTVSPSAKSDKPVWPTGEPKFDMPNMMTHISIERLKRFIKDSGDELNTNVGIFRYNVKTDGFVFIMYDAFYAHYLLSVKDLVEHVFLPTGERFIFKHLGGSKVVVNISETVPVLEFIPKPPEGYDWKAYQAKIDEGENEIPSSNDLLLKFKTELAAEVPVLNVLTKDVLVQLIYFNFSLTDPDNKLSVEQDSKFVQLLSRLPSADMWFQYVSV